MFEVGGDAVVGDLHLPDGLGRFAAVVVAGPMTSVKEQVTGVYAAALSERGIAALAIDHRGYGESDGVPRQYEHHGRKVEDLRAALRFLASRPEVAADRLGAAAVCLGSGYAAHAAAQEPLIRAAGFVAGYFRDPKAMRAADPEGFDAKVAEGRAARHKYEATGEVETVPAAALEGDAAMQTADTVDYYTRRAAVPNYRNAFAVMSREFFVPFDVQAAAHGIEVPVLMIHSEKALNPTWARQFFDALNAQKSMEWLLSSGQTDFYDDPGLVNMSADRLAEHFRRNLAGSHVRPP